ncbi:hypothetical protein I3760_09G102900 [Carya illinoinensis]|nr:hypothetical protein I3760_09G102900 [Carya illinoinensis]
MRYKEKIKSIRCYGKEFISILRKTRNLTFLRNSTSLRNQWSTILQATNKFCGYLAQVKGMHPSGFNKQDNIGKAKVMFLELEKKSFNFDHCWRVLRFHPKWVEHMHMVKPKKKPSSHDSTPNSINLDEDEDFHVASLNLERPIGRKVEKEKRKRKEMTNSDSLVVLNEMAEIRKSKLMLMQEAHDHDKQLGSSSTSNAYNRCS